MTNFDLSLRVFSLLQQAGVKEVVVCAGARNAPMVLALKSQSFKVYSFFEERSAAFFALGRIKSSSQPVAILTTSGTAVAELLPATIESFYLGLPLILLTADRPKNYRGTGSPQSIEQVGLFSHYVESIHEFDVNSEVFDVSWTLQKPIHLNISFDEPLIDQATKKTFQSNLIKKAALQMPLETQSMVGTNPLILLGEISEKHNSLVVDYILKTKAPVYAESLSQLKNNLEIKPYLLGSSENLIKNLFRNKKCDSVVRIGGVPTLRFWRDLEGEFEKIPVTNFSEIPFSGLARQSELISLQFLKATCEFSSDRLEEIKKEDDKLSLQKQKLLKKYALSEPTLTQQLSNAIAEAPLYLGNSLPIRNWDQFADVQSKKIAANRGANGIDGQISTYLGWSEDFDNSFCFVGDLTAMYDLVALGLMPQLRNKRNIIVCNNFGGQIFNRVFKNDEFINAHKIHFEHWAQMWNWNYLQIRNSKDFEIFKNLKSDFNIFEMIPDNEQTNLFWKEWDELCQKP